MVKLTHAHIVTSSTTWAARSRHPPPMNNPYDVAGRLGYTSWRYSFLAKRAVKMIPHEPQPPWSWKASKGSSYLNFSARRLHEIRTTADTTPHMQAAHGSTTEHPAVMAANPPSRPLHTSVTFQCPASNLKKRGLLGLD